MTVRTAYIGTHSAGDTLTSANLAKAPGGWIGGEVRTSDVSAITTEQDVTGLTVTVTVGTARRIKVTASIPRVTSTDADDGADIIIHEDGVQIGSGRVDTGGVIGASFGGNGRDVVAWSTPSAGSHTYKVRAARAVGTGNIALRGAATAPMLLLVEDIGPAS
jgi:hypothetical protein